MHVLAASQALVCTTLCIKPWVSLSSLTKDWSKRNQPIKYTVELVVIHSSHVIDVGSQVTGWQSVDDDSKDRNWATAVSNDGRFTTRCINRLLEQVMIGQADIDNQDVVWATSIHPRNHQIQCSAQLVSGIGVSSVKP